MVQLVVLGVQAAIEPLEPMRLGDLGVGVSPNSLGRTQPHPNGGLFGE